MTIGIDSDSVPADAGKPGSAGVQSPAFTWMLFSGAALLTALGCVGFTPVLTILWNYWMYDPLRSIGLPIVAAALLLTLLVWRQRGWELRGTWWGLAPMVLALALSIFRESISTSLTVGGVHASLLPGALLLYLYASGIVLLLAGARVWRQAWFPLVLLLFAQPVPYLGATLVDHPLQQISAHIARSFAALIGFAPASNPEMLRLMFTPNFGMFIAPGCDGIRGAVTLGYIALVLGYLKRVSVPRWIMYVAGAVLLGYLFNLLRLCLLVLYYRVAAGHPALENVAAQADYVIGGLLFLLAAAIFFRLTRRAGSARPATGVATQAAMSVGRAEQLKALWKLAAFAVVVAPVVILWMGALGVTPGQAELPSHVHSLTAQQLNELMPKQIGEYRLTRTWQEQIAGINVAQEGAYTRNGASELMLGVWLSTYPHTIHDSLADQGKDPELRANQTFITAQGKPVAFDVGYYSDGIADSLYANVFCSLESCRTTTAPPSKWSQSQLEFHIGGSVFSKPASRLLPMMLKVEQPHTDQPRELVHKQLTDEAQQFLRGLDMAELSRAFQ